jgi:hypothetical protein
VYSSPADKVGHLQDANYLPAGDVVILALRLDADDVLAVVEVVQDIEVIGDDVPAVGQMDYQRGDTGHT